MDVILSARMLMKWAVLFALAAAMITLDAAESISPRYKSGFAALQSLGRDIHRSLPPAEKKVISAQPISLETSSKPFIRLLREQEGNVVARGVWVSQGFIDLVNQLAHAKAIDKRKRGYFQRYMRILENSGDQIPPLPEAGNPAFWSEDMLNEQWSNFNSIMGIIVATQLAQHYLGFHEKYAMRQNAPSGRDGAPVNQHLSRDEWEQTYRLGLQNAMQASCMTEGFLPVCESIARMRHQPDWAAYFLPDPSWFSAMRKDMSKIQHEFLSH